jgi:hypothetical protein
VSIILQVILTSKYILKQGTYSTDISLAMRHILVKTMEQRLVTVFGMFWAFLFGFIVPLS